MSKEQNKSLYYYFNEAEDDWFLRENRERALKDYIEAVEPKPGRTLKF
jgi:hypothetical protein